MVDGRPPWPAAGQYLRHAGIGEDSARSAGRPRRWRRVPRLSAPFQPEVIRSVAGVHRYSARPQAGYARGGVRRRRRGAGIASGDPFLDRSSRQWSWIRNLIKSALAEADTEAITAAQQFTSPCTEGADQYGSHHQSPGRSIRLNTLARSPRQPRLGRVRFHQRRSKASRTKQNYLCRAACVGDAAIKPLVFGCIGRVMILVVGALGRRILAVPIRDGGVGCGHRSPLGLRRPSLPGLDCPRRCSDGPTTPYTSTSLAPAQPLFTNAEFRRFPSTECHLVARW
jgi:hypothetical protein